MISSNKLPGDKDMQLRGLGTLVIEKVVNASNGIFSMLGNLGRTGNYSWYPNGGDHGYTRIVEQSGAAFSS